MMDQNAGRYGACCSVDAVAQLGGFGSLQKGDTLL